MSKRATTEEEASQPIEASDSRKSTYKVLCIGDPHFKESTKEENDLMVKAILGVVDEFAPDHIVVMGDLLDRHKNAHLVPLRDATDFIYNLSEKATTHVLIGNHDMINDQQFLPKYHPFPGVRERDGLVIVSDRVEFQVPGTIQDGEDASPGRFIFLPFIPTGRLDEALGEIPPDTISVFCHQMFRGATFRGVSAPEGADYWPEERPMAISGHVHEYQRLGDNLVYVGTPRQSDFGDGLVMGKKSKINGADVPKGLSLFTYSWSGRHVDECLCRSNTTHICISEHRIPLELPGFVTHFVAVEEMHTWAPPSARSVSIGGEVLYIRDRHRIYVNGPEADVKMYLSSKHCDTLGKQGIVAHEGHLTDLSVEYDSWRATDAYAYLAEVERAIGDNPRELRWHHRIRDNSVRT